jgi:hypothetical protein
VNFVKSSKDEARTTVIRLARCDRSYVAPDAKDFHNSSLSMRQSYSPPAAAMEPLTLSSPAVE